MPIFRRDSEPEGTAETIRSSERPMRSSVDAEARFTRIAAGNQMVGEITGSTDVVIEGDLQGEVRIAGTVRVSREGRVRGGLDAGVVEVAGKVRGDVSGRELITLDRSAELYGNLSAPRVVIHEGAFFKGQVEMVGEGKTEARPASPGLFADAGKARPKGSPDPEADEGGDG